MKKNHEIYTCAKTIDIDDLLEVNKESISFNEFIGRIRNIEKSILNDKNHDWNNLRLVHVRDWENSYIEVWGYRKETEAEQQRRLKKERIKKEYEKKKVLEEKKLYEKLKKKFEKENK